MVGTAIAMGIHSGMNIQITKQIGGVSMGGVIIILTRGMGERLTYGIPARYRVVLMDCSSMVGAPVSEILFAGHSGLYRCESLVMSILFCVCDSFGGL